MPILSFGHTQIIVDCDSATPVQNGYLLSGAQPMLRLPAAPERFYHHGWQSWSLAAWSAPQTLPEQKPAIYHPLQIDPLYAHHPAPHGNWLGAVEFADGNILFLGSLGLEAHVQLREGRLQGWVETGPSTGMTWFAACGPEEQIFAAYARLLQEKLGRGRAAHSYRVWCSWYSLYSAIDEAVLARTFQALGDLPFDVLQVDDGWQMAIGDWQANKKFPSGMGALADGIKATGRKAGLWLAPLIALDSSHLFQQHPDWFLRDEDGHPVQAGFHWGGNLYALDTTHPAALDWLAALMRQVRAWGFDYVKLDFLYAGALPGVRKEALPRETAYRQGLAVMREALGPEAYLLACGAPILPSLGLCDALRVGPDVAPFWENKRDAHLLCNPTTPGVKNAIRTTLNRLWLAPLVHTDPDVAFFRRLNSTLTPAQSALLQDLARICNFKTTSDLPQWWTEAERQTVRAFLEQQSTVERTGRATFRLDRREVDFSAAVDVPLVRKKTFSLPFILWGSEQRWILRLMEDSDNARYEQLKQGL